MLNLVGGGGGKNGGFERKESQEMENVPHLAYHRQPCYSLLLLLQDKRAENCLFVCSQLIAFSASLEG